MPTLETPNELAEAIADIAGVYGMPDIDQHPEGCMCRGCFVSRMEERIIRSVHHHYQLESIRNLVEQERALQQMGLPSMFPEFYLLPKGKGPGDANP